MAHITATSTPQIEADRRLLAFRTYEDYLDSLITEQDRCYLQDTVAARTVVELGYRSSGETLSRQQFEKRLAAVIAYLYPTYKPYELASEGITGGDPIQKELAIRERPNRVGILSTIIFLRYQTRKGFEVSGYIDYAHRLSNQDWKPFFKRQRKEVKESRSDNLEAVAKHEENKERRTMSETITLTRSTTDFSGSAPKRYTTRCVIRPVTTPVWYSEGVFLNVGSSKRRYDEKVYLKEKLRPVKWSETMSTEVKTSPPCIYSELTIPLDASHDGIHYISLEPQQKSAQSTDL